MSIRYEEHEKTRGKMTLKWNQVEFSSSDAARCRASVQWTALTRVVAVLDGHASTCDSRRPLSVVASSGVHSGKLN